MTTPASTPNSTLLADLEPVGGELIDVAVTWLKSEKSAILARVDAGITQAGPAVALEIEAGIAAQGGIYKLVAPKLAAPITAAIAAAEAAGETEIGNLYDAGVAALEKEAASLGG